MSFLLFMESPSINQVYRPKKKFGHSYFDHNALWLTIYPSTINREQEHYLVLKIFKALLVPKWGSACPYSTVASSIGLYSKYSTVGSFDLLTQNSLNNVNSGKVQTLDWTTGMDYWTGTLDWHIFGFYTFLAGFIEFQWLWYPEVTCSPPL